jgi:hypothetical protein
MVLAVVCGICKVVGESLLVYDNLEDLDAEPLGCTVCNVCVLPRKSVNGSDKKMDTAGRGEGDSVKERYEKEFDLPDSL